METGQIVGSATWPARAAVKQIENAGGIALAVRTDVADPESVRDLVGQTIARYHQARAVFERIAAEARSRGN